MGYPAGPGSPRPPFSGAWITWVSSFLRSWSAFTSPVISSIMPSIKGLTARLPPPPWQWPPPRKDCRLFVSTWFFRANASPRENKKSKKFPAIRRILIKVLQPGFNEFIHVPIPKHPGQGGIGHNELSPGSDRSTVQTDRHVLHQGPVTLLAQSARPLPCFLTARIILSKLRDNSSISG